MGLEHLFITRSRRLFKDSVLLRQYSSFNYDLNRAQNSHIYKFRANTIKMWKQTKYQRNSFVECCDPKTNQTSHHSLLDVLHFDMEYVDFPSANASCIVYNMCVVECVCVRANFTLEENTVTMSPLCKWSKHFHLTAIDAFDSVFLSWRVIGSGKK